MSSPTDFNQNGPWASLSLGQIVFSAFVCVCVILHFLKVLPSSGILEEEAAEPGPQEMPLAKGKVLAPGKWWAARLFLPRAESTAPHPGGWPSSRPLCHLQGPLCLGLTGLVGKLGLLSFQGHFPGDEWIRRCGTSHTAHSVRGRQLWHMLQPAWTLRTLLGGKGQRLQAPGTGDLDRPVHRGGENGGSQGAGEKRGHSLVGAEFSSGRWESAGTEEGWLHSH